MSLTLVKARVFAALLCAACSSGNLKTPDLGAPVDMSSGGGDLSFVEATMVAPAVTLTSCLAVAGERVYWSDSTTSSPRIVSTPFSGGEPTLVADGGDLNGCVVADADGVYYFNDRTLMKAPLAGGTPKPLATNQHVVTGHIVVAGGRIYWMTDTYGDVDAYNGKNAVVSVATSNQDPNAPPAVLLSAASANTGGIAVDDTSVYYSDSTGVFSASLSAPATTTPIGQSAIKPTEFAVGAGRVAVVEITALRMGDLAVFRPDGMGRVVLQNTPTKPLALDDRGVYVTGASGLTRLKLDGSGSQLLTSRNARAAALTAERVFFLDGATLWSVAR